MSAAPGVIAVDPGVATGLALGRVDLASFGDAARREWLVTNGIGGFAAGTVALATTRRYHGLLVAALRPPVERIVTVAKADVLVNYRGRDYALTSNEYEDGTVDPHGYRYLESFRLDGSVPEWTWCLGDARVRQRVFMAYGENATYLTLEVVRAGAPVSFEFVPLCTYRDYHAHARGGREPGVRRLPDGVEIAAHAEAVPYRIRCDRGDFREDHSWHWAVRHRLEAERGLDAGEDLFRPGTFGFALGPGECAAVSFALGDAPPAAAVAHLHATRARASALLADVAGNAPAWIRQLTLAADQFVVARAGSEPGTTVIAGYPWFTDWGRDTMIALPGLTLATSRFDQAAAVLRNFAAQVSDGMLPNRFPDSGEAAEYNTVDATLWYFHAIAEYFRATRDRRLVGELYPVLGDIIRWHRRGTRYGIRVDAADGLLRAGEPGVQLTWMDAKVGEHVVTPRIGKPVEINALWWRALAVMGELAGVAGDAATAASFAADAAATAAVFRRRYWYAPGAYLFDVIDGPEGDDPTLRPNQILAASLGDGLLGDEQRRSVVEVCARELWTPHGLRSLARCHPDYAGTYIGDPGYRDAIYHQGTVWGWLLGPFVSAHLRAYRDPDAALAFLTPVASHLVDGCLGTIAEIFDGDEPNAARGCCAQAWSVGEVLRCWHEIEAARRHAALPAPQILDS